MKKKQIEQGYKIIKEIEKYEKVIKELVKGNVNIVFPCLGARKDRHVVRNDRVSKKIIEESIKAYKSEIHKLEDKLDEI